MLAGVKELIKAPRIRQLNRRYEAELDAQYVSYDSWIRQKELEYLAGTLPNTDDVQVVEYKEVGKTKYVADVVLFVNDRHKLSKRALHAVISVFNEYPEAVVVYGDEDEFNHDRTVRMNPILRPEWSPDTLTSYMYMGNVVAVKSKDIPADITDIYELILKITADLSREQVRHVDYVLYHNDYSKTLYLDSYKDGYEYNGELVSILIPSKDNPDVLKQVLKSITDRTTGVTYEIIVLDNGSTPKNKIRIEQIANEIKKDAKADLKALKYLYSPQDFNFSAICNELAGEASGEYLLFLNDDIEVRDGSWLVKMLKYASKPHVGAVGAKLYYPESKVIQHCGITNLRLGPVHKLQYKEDKRIYYDHANDVDRNVLAVTGACLMLRKDAFDLIGGFDESLAVAFNDVDLCYTLYEKGLYNVVVNTTHLWHYESLSRGDDESREKIVRLMKERERLYEKHPSLYMKDPYYHDYLTRDILDSNYTYAYEYEYDGSIKIKSKAPKKIKYRIKEKWYNECLIISLEQCGPLSYWLGPNESVPEDEQTIYIGGYSFVAGSDNSCFEFRLLFEGESGIYEIPCNKLYRPDLEINLDRNERPALCGFSVVPDLSRMPKGEYRVGVLAKGLASRLVLCRFTNRYITNE
ncbi:MAG: glycosyltransferase [Lachnospiraceae bacterium]|nr:glycosyltransferase [Lachnospiraceae bacterium]